MKRVGFGCARGDKLGWTTVLDLARGREAGPRPREVFYPVADQKGVPLNFPSNEEPNPIPENTTGRAGFPITATFPHQSPLLQSRGSLVDDAGRKVECWFSSPESPANPKYKSHQGTTVCLIPKSPLEPERTYRVTLTGVMAASEWRKTWKFTTGPAGFGVADGRRRFFDRLNASRRAAGLSPMTAGAELSSPCQAHADYLVRNGDRIGKAGFVVTDEDAKLPGFSVGGQQIARRAHVFTHAPTTAAQADHLLATLIWRVFALDPRQRRVGLGCGLEVGRGWVNVLDLQSPPDPPEPILFPAPDQVKVPCRGRDEKDVVGFPITALFPPEQRLRNVRATLVDAAGLTVDIRVSSSDVLAILPLRPLQPGTAYTVTINAEVDGQAWRRSWRFTTE